MGSPLYRDNGSRRTVSPEQLNDYIRVCSPGVWTVLIGVIVLLAGVCVWGVFGRLETTAQAVALSDGKSVVCYISETQAEYAQAGGTVRINGAEYAVTSLAAQAVQADGEQFTDYALHIGGMQRGEWVCCAQTDAALPAGVYSAELVTESISPMEFMFN